jgi:CDP-diacylglycerol--glycerol-3-phosphate 3-phosphatidyltransferase
MKFWLKVLTLPNILSFLRLPLAFVFLQPNPAYRAFALILALITDGLDGFIARRYRMVNPIGTLLDPLMDKFFVFFVLIIFISENRLTWGQACCLISRDFALVFYGCYLAFRGKLDNARFRAIWSGKITTVLQLVVILCLIFYENIWPFVYGISLILGIIAFIELYNTEKDHMKLEKSKG